MKLLETNSWKWNVSTHTTGKSDPYCRLGILNKAHLESHLVKHKDLVDWKTEGWVSKIGSTSIKLATLNPDWNEEVELWVGVGNGNGMHAIMQWLILGPIFFLTCGILSAF